MHNLAIRPLADAFLHRAKSLLVELDGASGIADRHIWRNRVVTLGNSFNSHGVLLVRNPAARSLHQKMRLDCQSSVKTARRRGVPSRRSRIRRTSSLPLPSLLHGPQSPPNALPAPAVAAAHPPAHGIAGSFHSAWAPSSATSD